MRQIGFSTADSVALSGRQQVYAVGPVIRWEIGSIILLAAAYQEFGASNRPEGISVNMRMQQRF